MSFRSKRRHILDAMGVRLLPDGEKTSGSLDCEALYDELLQHKNLEVVFNAIIYDQLLFLGYKMPPTSQFRFINFRDPVLAEAAMTMQSALHESIKPTHYRAMREWFAQEASNLAAGESWDTEILLDNICGAHMDEFMALYVELASSHPAQRHGKHEDIEEYEMMETAAEKVVRAAAVVAQRSQARPLAMTTSIHPYFTAYPSSLTQMAHTGRGK